MGDKAAETRKMYERSGAQVAQDRWKGQDTPGRSSSSAEVHYIVIPDEYVDWEAHNRSKNQAESMINHVAGRDAPAVRLSKGAPVVRPFEHDGWEGCKQALTVESVHSIIKEKGVSLVKAMGMLLSSSTAGQWQALRYVVKASMQRDVAARLHVDEFIVDVFGDRASPLCQAVWGPDVCWDHDWRGGPYWFNPSVSELSDCIKKIIRDQSTGVLILPDWHAEDAWWYHTAWQISADHYHYYAPDIKLYRDGPPQPLWGTWAILVQGKLAGVEALQDDEDAVIQPVEQQFQETSSWGRRRRRRLLKGAKQKQQ